MPIGDGNSAVRIVDTSGNTAVFDTSGRITIAGSITASISGDTIIAKVSGESVTLQSGSVTRILGAAGTATAPVTTANTDSLSATTNFLYTTSFPYALREQNSGFARIRMTESGQAAPMSGIGYNVAVNFSGAHAIANLGNSINVPAWTQVHGASGGVALNAAAGHTIKISNHSGNGAVLIGASGGNLPVSGTKGIMINPGSIEEFRVTNANLLSAVGHVSGNFISYMVYG